MTVLALYYKPLEHILLPSITDINLYCFVNAIYRDLLYGTTLLCTMCQSEIKSENAFENW